jgi:hypothetical protein
MIKSSIIGNTQISFPAVQGLAFSPLVKKIEIKNIYQQWQGESIEQIKNKTQENPYNMRIGLPKIDEQLRQDNMYLILSYLSYNPVNKDIENREIVTYRNTNKIIIGQSPDEYKFKNYKLFVDDNVVAKDYIFSDDEMSLRQTITHLANKIQKLQQEITNIKSQQLQPQKQTIYNQ